MIDEGGIFPRLPMKPRVKTYGSRFVRWVQIASPHRKVTPFEEHKARWRRRRLAEMKAKKRLAEMKGGDSRGDEC